MRCERPAETRQGSGLYARVSQDRRILRCTVAILTGAALRLRSCRSQIGLLYQRRISSQLAEVPRFGIACSLLRRNNCHRRCTAEVRLYWSEAVVDGLFTGLAATSTTCAPAAPQQQYRFDGAVYQLREANQLSPRPSWSLGALGHAMGCAGRAEEAQTSSLVVPQLSQELVALLLALTHLGLEEREKSVPCLERACDERDFHLVLLKMDPRFSALCGGERFESILKKGGLTRTRSDPSTMDEQVSSRVLHFNRTLGFGEAHL